MTLNQDMADILLLLGEDILPPGSSSTLTGANTAQIASSMPDVSMRETDYIVAPEASDMEDGDQYSALELKLTKRYIELIGGAERARDLINKCDECMECLGVLDDTTQTDVDTIQKVSEYMPQDVDFPTNNKMDLATLYNPNAVIGPYNR
jgi:hypothetical protein